MTKEMYQKCLNENMVIFGKLPKYVQDAITSSCDVNILNMDGKWEVLVVPMGFFNSVYRIDPSTPYDPEFEEKEVIETDCGYLGLEIDENCYSVASAACLPNCLGIIYEKDGVETLRTSVDLAFGTPKRVRFAK